MYIRIGFGATETLCQGDIVMCTCTNDRELYWNGTALTNQCAKEIVTYTISNLSTENITESQCGAFNVSTFKQLTPNQLNRTQSIPEIMSTLIFKAVDDLNGDTIMCIRVAEMPLVIELSKYPYNHDIKGI